MELCDDVDAAEDECQHRHNYMDALFIRYQSNKASASDASTSERAKHDDDNDDYRSRHADFNINKVNITNTNENLGDFRMSVSDYRKSVSSERRSSSPKRLKALVEPTYRMEPKPDQYFVWYKVRNALVKMITPLFATFVYDGKSAPSMCKLVCNKSVSAIKKFDLPRYRYVCHVTLIPLQNQGVIIADRSLWMPEYDNYAVCQFRNNGALMVVTFYGIYQE